MLKRLLIFAVLAVAFALFFAIAPTMAQLGNSGSLAGTVKDPSGGVVAAASVAISYPVSGFQRQATTDADGNFKFTNVPFNPYHYHLPLRPRALPRLPRMWTCGP